MSKFQIKTFPVGGIHPADNKLSARKAIEKLPLPQTVSIPISQHLGKPAKPIVNPMDNVKVGQLIAQADGLISANIHSSVSGAVTKIDDVMDITGYKRMAVVIQVNGDQWNDGIDTSPEFNNEITASAQEIIDKVRDAGIVGLGGATFPSHVKLSPPKDKKIEYVMINGAECEPFLTSDHRLMLEKANEITVGTLLILKALGVDKAFIGIENNKPGAIAKLRNAAFDYPEIEAIPLKTLYPQGGERQLIKAIVNREIPPPPEGLPHDVGCAVFNVATAFAIYEAVQKNKPLVERVVTITGKSVSRPSNFLVRFGTPVANLIEAAGGLPEDTGKILGGGPMMGRAISTTDIPVTKGIGGVLVVTKNETRRREVLNCIRCAKCVSMCPLGLEPYLLMALAEKSQWDTAEQTKVLNCCECGCCSYVCPSNRPLLDYLKFGKSVVMKNRQSRKSS